MDPIRRQRRLTAGRWLLALGIALPLLGLHVSTWERNYHGGSVWHFENQRDLSTESWSEGAIRANVEYLTVAGSLALVGLTLLVLGLVVIVRTQRDRRRG
ncbi:hypothetical protein [Cellulosimicrobium marinum]|uniref:hypothetical protein n=1 Tax=Cellulosimicrobium marinum TaxID=1638992 RepID=UPI001E650D64|nr:hypothetical protein [Cellulosimicrobium marinum]MCB7135830.1 hypothetical protein [Cellulosimicrobium marinum]